MLARVWCRVGTCTHALNDLKLREGGMEKNKAVPQNGGRSELGA